MEVEMKARHKIQAHKRKLFLMLMPFGAFAVAGASFAARPEPGTSPVNTSGVASLRGMAAHVDNTGHVVNAKGFRVGGRTDDP